MLKEILKKLGVDFAEDISDEDAQRLIDEEIGKKDEHITTLESEKEALSKSNEELSTSVEGYKSSEEKLNKELSDTKTELVTTKAKLEQITEMYKDQFTKDPNEIEVVVIDDKKMASDVLQQILDTK